MHTMAHELNQVIQQRQPAPVIQAAQQRLDEERAAGMRMRQYAQNGQWDQCARVR
jgi:hypothetical protein